MMMPDLLTAILEQPLEAKIVEIEFALIVVACMRLWRIIEQEEDKMPPEDRSE